MSDEKRRFSRIFFNVKAELAVGETVYSIDRIANLSIGGCLLEIEDELPLGSNCKLTVLLPGKLSGVDVLGEVVRTGKGEVGLKFTTIEHENLFHLQNIIRYNAEDPDMIEEEISVHPGLK